MSTITITEEEYADLLRTQETLDWLEGRGLCWRGVDAFFAGWVVGSETEWHYSISGDVRDLVDQHRAFLSSRPK